MDTYDDYEPEMCECEIDWNCGCGRNGGFTHLETRFTDEPEPLTNVDR